MLDCALCSHPSAMHSFERCEVHGCTCIGIKPHIPEAKREEIYIPMDRLLLKPNAVSGMNPLVVMSLTYMYRSSVLDSAPIVVQEEGEFYRIMDGRHRMVASLIAGRPTVLAVIEEKS